MPQSSGISDTIKARLLLVGLGLAWGLTWPAMRIALIDIPPFTMRALSAFIGAASLFALARVAGRGVRLPPKNAWSFIVIVAMFNIVIFSICTAFAQLTATTGRVAIIVYTMPIWASLFAWFLLGERLTTARAIALLLCIAGMGVLIYPLAGAGVPFGLLLALGASISWSLGTIYIKRSRIEIEPYTLAAWQLAVALLMMFALALYFDSSFQFSTVRLHSWLGLIFSGLFGSAVAYYLWFQIIRLMPVTTASLGALSSPVIGVISSTMLLNEWPTIADIIGYALIFSASATALLQPQVPVLAPKRS